MFDYIVSYSIIALTVLISYSGFKRFPLIERYSFNPYQIQHNRQYDRVFTHLFFHADEMHLFFNMLSFFFVGRFMELLLVQFYGPFLGRVHFLLIYFGGAIIGTLYAYSKNKNNPSYQSIGASGAVSASIFAFIIWRPDVDFYLFFAIPMKSYVFGILFLAFEYFSMKRKKGRIAHDVHLFSAIFGLLYVLAINPSKGYQFIHLFS